MPGTVRHNMGTVGEHIALSCVVDWVCEFCTQEGPIRYVDTHAMAPFNVPIGNDQPRLVNDLSDRFRDPITDEISNGMRSYIESVREATIQLRDRGVDAWYPTHFLHAWSAARRHGAEFDAYLFENDGEGAGRRASLSEFVPIANFLLECEGFRAALAPVPGDFRVESAWPLPALRPGRALVLMSDPLQFQEKRTGGSYMDLSDIRLIARELNHRYLQCPHLTACVVFCFSNPGYASRYQDLTELITEAWTESFAANECAVVGIQWGSFMFFVGASNNGTAWSDPTFAEAFSTLEQRIEAGLNLAHPSLVTLHHPH